MVVNENLNFCAEKVNEQEPTTTTSPFSVMPISFAMPSPSMITPAIERNREDVENENLRKKPSEEDQIKSKRIVKTSKAIDSDEVLLFDCIFVATKDPRLGYLYIIKIFEYDIFYT